ncbi:sterol desaturase/sphingolipid hydroxylase (fatty acid hydroxylase superfamily) [Novosphingobium kunmingense]|uniref:Sterol desaturase/sphingolipid hydroxylase (Fatty acid hydroxylase superfamily) n=1 Tax=Novosphingobium kunmingense TaxID=1211806 RepID=A0A2N0H5M4_9SPHN|nr:sterol desaturase family protein [Novosphingobium kunmingense]PKB14217.1 sterol desaturase/sphingolipid hydroxylase (fatty acid hydroxylase superfamily) [Novosphingobium kunmingense]
MPQLTPVDYAVPFFILLILIEVAWARRRAPASYEARDTLSSLAMGLGSTVAGALAAGLITAAAFTLYQFRLVDIGWAWWAWIACFVLDDFNYYWAHRTGHRVRWFWASHVNHHSSQHYNLSTALRQTWTGFPALSFLFRIWPVLIGFHPGMIATVGAVNLVYQFWIHTEAVRRMPRWFEAVMNTPSHHRVHHAVNPVYLDRNYAGVFIVWDRLFGSFQPEIDGVRIHYGIIRQLGSFNLFHTAFHEWIAMASDVRRAPWRAKLGYLVREPGWTHDNSRDTSDTIRARWQAMQGPGVDS